MNTHRCPYPNCDARVPSRELACKLHWFKLPKAKRDEVWAAWRSGNTARHAAALQDAIAYLADHAERSLAHGDAR